MNEHFMRELRREQVEQWRQEARESLRAHPDEASAPVRHRTHRSGASRWTLILRHWLKRHHLPYHLPHHA